MKINYKIDYITAIATCPQLKVLIRATTEPTMQSIKGFSIGIGFQKKVSEIIYQCYILDISDNLLDMHVKDNKLLQNYTSQLGDQFNEDEFLKVKTEEFKSLLGEVPTQTELSTFKKVSKGAVSQWSNEKKNNEAILMMLEKVDFPFPVVKKIRNKIK